MSEEEQFDLFCTQCGQKLTKDATFCPSCGAQVSEMTEAPANSGNSNPSYGAPYQRDMSGRLKVISIILFVSAGLFVLFGIYMLGAADSFINAMKESSSWSDIVRQIQENGMTEQEFIDMFKAIFIASGALYLISAVLVGLAGFFGIKRKYWGLGFAFCIIVTVLQFSLVGLVITILWYTTKPAFNQ